LLLLRLAVGSLALAEGVACVTAHSAALTLLAGGIVFASGVALLIGLVTPLAGVLVMLGVIGAALSWLPTPAFQGFESKVMTGFVGIVAAAIVLLGPGALSLDSRLFGRREIIIPPPNRSPQS
jgi:hypothetical protein